MLNSDKATDTDWIPVKFIKLSATAIDSDLANTIHKNIDLNCYSKNAENANVLFKKVERTKLKNYQSVTRVDLENFET